MLLWTGTGYSREKVSPGTVIIEPGYYFTIDETKDIVRKLDLADIERRQNEALKRSAAISEKEYQLLLKEVELEKRSTALSDKESGIYKDLYKKSEDSRRADRKSSWLRDVLRTGVEIALIGKLF